MPDDSRHRDPLRTRLTVGLTAVLVLAAVVIVLALVLMRQDAGPLEGRGRSPAQPDTTGTLSPERPPDQRPAIPPRPQVQP
jgi:hypothetical protein